VTRIFQVANTSRAAILTDDPARASVKEEKEMREMNHLILPFLFTFLLLLTDNKYENDQW
jgi:hypothetical protein